MRWQRFLAYGWACPASLLGLLLLPLAAPFTGGRVRWRAGVLELHGRGLEWCLRRLVPLNGGASALTLGHVVIARNQDCLDATRAHERVHVGQYEGWGSFFLPAYLLAGLWQLVRGRNAYWDNPFEREAYGHAMAEGEGGRT